MHGRLFFSESAFALACICTKIQFIIEIAYDDKQQLQFVTTIQYTYESELHKSSHKDIVLWNHASKRSSMFITFLFLLFCSTLVMLP